MSVTLLAEMRRKRSTHYLGAHQDLLAHTSHVLDTCEGGERGSTEGMTDPKRRSEVREVKWPSIPRACSQSVSGGGGDARATEAGCRGREGGTEQAEEAGAPKAAAAVNRAVGGVEEGGDDCCVGRARERRWIEPGSAVGGGGGGCGTAARCSHVLVPTPELACPADRLPVPPFLSFLHPSSIHFTCLRFRSRTISSLPYVTDVCPFVAGLGMEMGMAWRPPGSVDNVFAVNTGGRRVIRQAGGHYFTLSLLSDGNLTLPYSSSICTF